MNSRLSIDYYFFSLVGLICNLFKAVYVGIAGLFGHGPRGMPAGAHSNSSSPKKTNLQRRRQLSMDQSCDKGGSAYNLQGGGNYGSHNMMFTGSSQRHNGNSQSYLPTKKTSSSEESAADTSFASSSINNNGSGLRYRGGGRASRRQMAGGEWEVRESGRQYYDYQIKDHE